MEDFNNATIYFQCDAIKKGKPCSCEPIKNRDLKEVLDIIYSLELKSHTEYLSEGWTTVFTYKEDYMLDIIKQLPDKPETAFDHWVLGKAFGYSDEAIKNFINKKGC